MTAPATLDDPWGIYLHIPFCARICPYCDFNTYAHQEDLIPAYVDALTREMDLLRERHGPVPAATVFFGGGTPSLLEPEQIERLVGALRGPGPAVLRAAGEAADATLSVDRLLRQPGASQ